MARILSEKEIEALKEALAEKQIPLDDKEVQQTTQVQQYDFIFQKRLSPRLSAFLNVVFSRFVVNLRASLSLRLRRVVRTQLLNFDYQKYTDLIEGLPGICWIEILGIEPFHGHCLLVVNPELALILIDLLCGGNGKVIVNKEGFNSFAPLEQSLMRKIIDFVLSDLEEAWQTVIPEIKITSKGSEFNPQLLTGFSPDDVFTVIPIKVTIGEFNGNMAFCIPHYTIEPFKNRIEGEKEEAKEGVNPETLQKIINNLLNTEVEIRVELAQKQMSLEDVINLQVGQVIDLNKSVSEEITIKVEGVPRFKGYPVQMRGNKAVKISEILAPFILEEEENEIVHSEGKSKGNS